MKTIKAAIAARLRQERLEAFKRSGESVSQWSKQNGVHRTTMYRWLRQDAKNKPPNTKTTTKGTKEQDSAAKPIKWLPVMAKSSEGIESEVLQSYQTAKGTSSSHEEIRVQIGNFTIITPEGFPKGAFEEVCRTLMSIC